MDFIILFMSIKTIIEAIEDYYTDTVYRFWSGEGFMEFVKVTKIRVVKTKQKKDMVFCNLTTFSGQSIECIIFPDEWAKYCHKFVDGLECFLIGNLAFSFNKFSVIFKGFNYSCLNPNNQA